MKYNQGCYGIPGMKQYRCLIIPNVSGVAKRRRMDSVVPEPPQHVQEERFGANFQPLPSDILVTFQRFPGFALLAKHAAAIHKVTTQWRRRGDRTPRAVAKHSSYEQLEQKRYH